MPKLTSVQFTSAHFNGEPTANAIMSETTQLANLEPASAIAPAGSEVPPAIFQASDPALKRALVAYVTTPALVSEIARQHGFSASLLSHWAHKLGLPSRGRGRRRLTEPNPYHRSILALVENHGIAATALRIGRTRQYVHQIVARWAPGLRPQYEVSSRTVRRHYVRGHLRTMDPSLVRLHCLPGGKATVTARGIRFNGLFYSCGLALRERWFETARASKTWSVDVAFDPRCVDQIYLRSPDTRVVETCHLVEAEQRFLSRTWDEVDDFILSQKGQQNELRTEQLQGAVDLQAQAQAIVDKARKEAAVANQGLTKAAKLRGVRENRAAEQALLAESMDPEVGTRSKVKVLPPSPGPTAQEAAAEDEYVAPPCPLDLLQQQRDAKFIKE